MDDLPEAFVIQESRTLTALEGIVHALLLILLYVVKWWTQDNSLVMWAALISGTIIAPAVAIKMGIRTKRPATLVADQDGFTENAWPWGTDKFKWSEVVLFKVATIHNKHRIYVWYRETDQAAHDATTEEPSLTVTRLDGRYYRNKRYLAEELATKLNTRLRTQSRS